MTAAQSTTKHVAQHAAEKASRFHLPARLDFRAALADRKVARAAVAAKPVKATPISPAHAERVRAVVVNAGDTKPVTKARRVTSTGQALFSVDKAGKVTRNAVAVTRDGVSTFADFTSGALKSAYDTHWLTQMFETEPQRQTRVNAQLVAGVLGIVASVVARKK